MRTYFLGIAFSLIIFVTIVIKLRNANMKERYATWWMIIGLLVLFVSVVPQILTKTASLLGVQVPLNLGLMVASIVMLLAILRLSVDLSHLDEDKRTLAEHIAFLETKLERVEAQLESQRSSAQKPEE